MVGKWDFPEFTLLGYWPDEMPYASKFSWWCIFLFLMLFLSSKNWHLLFVVT